MAAPPLPVTPSWTGGGGHRRQIFVPRLVLLLLLTFHLLLPTCHSFNSNIIVPSTTTKLTTSTTTSRLFGTTRRAEKGGGGSVGGTRRDDDVSPCDDHQLNASASSSKRRSVLLTSLLTSLALTQSSTSVANAAATTSSPTITNKVKFNVRISRSDGTFYIRDDLQPSFDNNVFTFSLVFGLFGNESPNSVTQFLKYVSVKYNPTDDNPLPSYGRSMFTGLDAGTGLIKGGYIPSLAIGEFGGSSVLEYGDRIVPANFWYEKSSTDGTTSRMSHTEPGLLTHRTLDLLPQFEITTRPAPELDGTHIIFGKLLPNEESSKFLEVVGSIPKYSMERPESSVGGETTTQTERVTEGVASAVFTKQREFFRGAAKTFGDSRIDKVYEGKFLRRVEVTSVEVV